MPDIRKSDAHGDRVTWVDVGHAQLVRVDAIVSFLPIGTAPNGRLSIYLWGDSEPIEVLDSDSTIYRKLLTVFGGTDAD